MVLHVHPTGLHAAYRLLATISGPWALITDDRIADPDEWAVVLPNKMLERLERNMTVGDTEQRASDDEWRQFKKTYLRQRRIDVRSGTAE